jgi:hypothetical protein
MFGAMATMARAFNRFRAPGQPSSAGGPFFGFASDLDARAAFTIVEVLVGVAILALTTVALYGAFSFGFTTIRLSQEEVRADQILVQKLETLRIYDWSALTNNYLPATFSASYSTTGVEHGVTYDVSLSVAPYVQSAANESYADTLRQVTASVAWLSGGVPRTRSMTTLVSQYGIQTYKKP